MPEAEGGGEGGERKGVEGARSRGGGRGKVKGERGSKGREKRGWGRKEEEIRSTREIVIVEHLSYKKTRVPKAWTVFASTVWQ